MCWIAAKRRAAPNQPGGKCAPPSPQASCPVVLATGTSWLRSSSAFGLREVCPWRAQERGSPRPRDCGVVGGPPFPHGALRGVVPTQGTTLQGGARRNVAAGRRHAGAKWSTKRGPHSTPTSCGPRRAANSAPQARRLSTCSRVWISAHLARPSTHRRPACLSFSSLATRPGLK